MSYQRKKKEPCEKSQEKERRIHAGVQRTREKGLSPKREPSKRKKNRCSIEEGKQSKEKGNREAKKEEKENPRLKLTIQERGERENSCPEKRKRTEDEKSTGETKKRTFKMKRRPTLPGDPTVKKRTLSKKRIQPNRKEARLSGREERASSLKRTTHKKKGGEKKRTEATHPKGKKIWMTSNQYKTEYLYLEKKKENHQKRTTSKRLETMGENFL